MLRALVFERKARLIRAVGGNKSHSLKASSLILTKLLNVLLEVRCCGVAVLPRGGGSRSRGVLGARLEGLH